MGKFMEIELIAFAFLVTIVNVGICVPLETISDSSSSTQTPVSNSSLTDNSISSNATVFCNSTNSNCNNASNAYSVNTTQLPKNLSTNTAIVAVAVNLSSICSSNATKNIAVYCDGSKLNLTKICGKTNGTNVSINCVNITQSLVDSGTSLSAKINFTTSTNASESSDGRHTLISNSAVIAPTISVTVVTQELQATPIVVSSSVFQVQVSKTTSQLFPSSVQVSISPTITAKIPATTSRLTTTESTTSQSKTTESATSQSTTTESVTSQTTTAESGTTETTEVSTVETNTQKTTTATTGSTTKLTTVAPSTLESGKTAIKTEESTENPPKATTLKMAGTSTEEATSGTIETESYTFKPTFESQGDKNAKEVKFFYVNVLIPIGAGVCGALAIALAVIIFRCCRRRKLKKVRYFGKPTRHMMYMDQMNLLDDSSEEE